MEIKRAGSQPSSKGPFDWFTGTVRIDPPPEPALVQGASVTFEPGARTAWHTHPLGQALIGMRLTNTSLSSTMLRICRNTSKLLYRSDTRTIAVALEMSSWTSVPGN